MSPTPTPPRQTTSEEIRDTAPDSHNVTVTRDDLGSSDEVISASTSDYTPITFNNTHALDSTSASASSSLSSNTPASGSSPRRSPRPDSSRSQSRGKTKTKTKSSSWKAISPALVELDDFGPRSTSSPAFSFAEDYTPQISSPQNLTPTHPTSPPPSDYPAGSIDFNRASSPTAEEGPDMPIRYNPPTPRSSMPSHFDDDPDYVPASPRSGVGSNPASPSGGDSGSTTRPARREMPQSPTASLRISPRARTTTTASADDEPASPSSPPILRPSPRRQSTVVDVPHIGPLPVRVLTPTSRAMVTGRINHETSSSPTRTGPQSLFRHNQPASPSGVREEDDILPPPPSVGSPSNRFGSALNGDPPARPPRATQLRSFDPPSRASPPKKLDIPNRPTFHQTNSATHLLGSDSDPNTPASPSPSHFSANVDPFRDASPRVPAVDESEDLDAFAATTSPSMSRSLRNKAAQAQAQPPSIRINSLSTSPGSGAGAGPLSDSLASRNGTSAVAPNFEPRRSFTTPFAETHRDEIDELDGGVSAGKPSFSSAVSKPESIATRRSARKPKIQPKRARRDVRNTMGNPQVSRKPFQSTRLKEGEEIYKPWLEKRDPAMRWARWITLISILIGLALAGVICWDGYNSVPKLGNICSVLNDDFSGGINTDVWTREVRLDGYGHGEFEWTTNSDNNSFVKDGTLYLVPTLTSDIIGDDAITNGYTLNLTADGTCTSTNVSQCVAVSNSSRLTVINPVRSARLTTRNSVNIKYGKVEVVAKLPTGDWLWPSIFMLPVNETYGPWPRSGEIDLLEARGNNASYPNRGVDYAQSSLHWGPTTDLDRLYMTWGYREQRRTYYSQQFHTFGLEWNENYMWTYIDSRVSQVISLRFGSESFWTRGKFPSTITNSTTGDVIKLTNPWSQSTNNVAPFDQAFYLTLSLGVGSTDGWFPDGEGGKPWLDDSGTAASDFWIAKDKWWNNWSSDPTVRGFAIKSVKMWKTC